MKAAIIASMAFAGQSLKWDRLKVPPEARGEINDDEHYWTGHLTECDDQCDDQGGTVCGTEYRQCCKAEACV